MKSKISADIKDRYARDSAKYRPRTPHLKNLMAAFVVGGLISAAGQGLHEAFVSQGLDDAEAGARMAIVLIVVGALLTAFGLYDRIGKVSGAGSAIPISGFSNSIVSAAMEFSRDGYILGMASQFFAISGPVLVAGISSAVLFSFIRYLFILSGG